MVDALIFLAAMALILQTLIGLSFLVSCIWEKERRATFFAGLQFLAMFGVLILYLYLTWIGFFEAGLGLVLLVVALVLGAVAVFIFMRRTSPNKRALQGAAGLIVGDVKRHDEREIVSVRNRLRPGSAQYKEFYAEHPEYKDYDTRRRKIGGAAGPHPGAIDRPYEGPNMAATLACWFLPIYLSAPDKLKPQPHLEFRGKRVNLSPEEATERVKGYTQRLGADLVGITEINPLWIYSHRGNTYHDNGRLGWEDWGKEIKVEHKYAIVFGTEMSLEMIAAAPHTPSVVESMLNYSKGAYIATQLAAYIANLGYSATANRTRHYEAPLVPLAVDAGLGELGRLGYLITKKFGPRVRLGAVTTDLPLMTDKPVDIGVEHFCKVCKKCAVCCPSNSIPAERDQTAVNGLLRWKLNNETCFEYWAKVGTDCNICMRVCPWSHARTLPHKIIIALITRNRFARHLFSLMDDIFYGKKPKAKTAPKWAQFGREKKNKGERSQLPSSGLADSARI